MPTKAELQAENELLREQAGAKIAITGNTFHAPVRAETVAAVLELAKALRAAAEALKGTPHLVISPTEETQ